MLKRIESNPLSGQVSRDFADTGLKKACTEFESLFLNHILKSMRKGIVSNGPLGNSNESKIMRSMSDEALARGIAKGGGIGLADILFEQLKDSRSAGAPPATQDRTIGDWAKGRKGVVRERSAPTD